MLPPSSPTFCYECQVLQLFNSGRRILDYRGMMSGLSCWRGGQILPDQLVVFGSASGFIVHVFDVDISASM
ncbi:hypothetical protein HID58_038061, partial [Brassica napus]